MRILNNIIKEKPILRYYEGKSGLRSMAEEFSVAKENETARMMFSYDLLQEIFADLEIKEMRKQRQNKKMKARAIVNDKNNIKYFIA